MSQDLRQPSKTPEKLVTLTFQVPESSMARLGKLVDRVRESPSETDEALLGGVTANAYRLYETVIEEAEAGAKFYIERKDQPIAPWEIF